MLKFEFNLEAAAGDSQSWTAYVDLEIVEKNDDGVLVIVTASDTPTQPSRVHEDALFYSVLWSSDVYAFRLDEERFKSTFTGERAKRCIEEIISDCNNGSKEFAYSRAEDLFERLDHSAFNVVEKGYDEDAEEDELA